MRLIRTAFTLIELLVVIAIIGICIALLLPAVQKTRDASNRLRCQNDLRNMGIALHNYHGEQGRFPPGVSEAAAGEPTWYWSWMAFLLPYIEQSNMNNAAMKFAQTPTPNNFQPWNPWGVSTHIQNPALGHAMPIWQCPADPRILVARDIEGYTIAFTTFLGVAGTRGDSIGTANRNGMLYHSSRVKIAEVTDGTSNTAMVGERPPSSDLWYGWWFAGAGYQDTNGRQLGVGDVVLGAREEGYAAKLNCNPTANSVGLRPGNITSFCDQAHFWSQHSGGTNFLMADGAVRFTAYRADAILNQLFTRSGGESVETP